MQITRRRWGTVFDREVALFDLDDGAGTRATVSDFGGLLTSLVLPDEASPGTDVVLGCDTVEAYVAASPYFGAMVGRCANRIAKARFTLDGVSYALSQNEPPNHLHGGARGFDKVVWQAEPDVTADGARLRLRHRSPAGDQGYPGTLDVVVDYVLEPGGALRIDTSATTDAPTPVNVVHHSYFNLAGHGQGDVLDHELTLFASRYTPTDASLIPTGALAPVAGTPYDFRTPKAVGRDLAALQAFDDPAESWDVNFVLDCAEPAPWHAARLAEPRYGRVLDVYTTAPGLQLYAGRYLDDVAGKRGAVYGRHGGICLETQCFPDAVNQREREGWPDPVLRPGETYRHTVIHRFGRLAS